MSDSTANEPAPQYTDAELGELIRQGDQRVPLPPDLADPEVFTRWLLTEHEHRQEQERRARRHRTLFRAASILVAITAGAIWYWAGGSPPPEVVAEFRPDVTAAGSSGPVSPEARALTVAVPPLAAGALGSAGRGYAVAIEFAPNDPPRVYPSTDALCPVVVPNRPTPLGGEPFVRPRHGAKWVLLLVTETPAASALAERIAVGADFDRANGPAATLAAVRERLQPLGHRVLAHGTLALEPLVP